jgi:hypothetical protein
MAETENKNTPPANAVPAAQNLDGDSLDAPGPDNKAAPSSGVGEPKQGPDQAWKAAGL